MCTRKCRDSEICEANKGGQIPKECEGETHQNEFNIKGFRKGSGMPLNQNTAGLWEVSLGEGSEALRE